jgi:radical SAM superfamily enzyme
MKRLTRKSVTLNVKVRQRHTYRLGQRTWDDAINTEGEIVALLPKGAVLHRLVYSVPTQGCVDAAWFVPWANLRPSADPKWL